MQETEKQEKNEIEASEKFEKRQVRTYRVLNVYRESFELAMEIFKITSKFPTEERYTLTDQIRRAARSIPANLAEGWAKRNYENIFKRHLYDSIGSCEEVKVWIEFAWKCGYLTKDQNETLLKGYAGVGAMLASLVERWQTF